MMSRSRNGIYKLDNLPFSSRDFHKKFTFISGPLSLFDEEDDPEEGNENPDVERTLTPVEDSIKGPIASFSSFAKLIRPRLTPKEGIPGLSVSDQQELIGVIMSEINNVWGDMKSLPPDPFLTYQENMELQRRLAIEIVTLAQGLFLKFLNKAQNLHERGVFSGTANMSRLKTQLAIDANKSFNVLSIRRNLAIDMKHPCDTSTISSTKLAYLGGKKTYKPLVVRQEEAKIRLTKEEMLQQRIKSELSDLKKQMPKLKADFFVGMFPEEVLDRSRRPTPSGPESIDTDSQPELMDVFIEETALREKCVSEPYLPTGESLLEELGLTEDDINVGMKGLPRSTSVNKVEEQILVKEIDGRISSKDIKLGTPEYASNDLRKLIASRGGKTQNENSQDDNSDDLPPLLQALTHYNTKRRDKIQEELDYDELLGDRGSVIGSSKASSVALDPTIIDEKIIDIVIIVVFVGMYNVLIQNTFNNVLYLYSITEFTGEDHPQPAVVSLRLPDKSVVRTSDVRVSNRVNKSSLVLQKYPTIYNDLTGEINPTTVKWLDRNLFIGDEIKEVYQEVIRTMNADFLLFDKDPYVERCATDIDVSLCNASTSLTKSKKDRIINQKLHRGIPPPWERDTADNWRNNPKFGGLGREDIIQSKIGKESSQEGKSYNSWLAWWRSTINFDDYLKYMSTQDNDFLSMIYHLYDSENDSDDEGSLNESRPTTVQLALGRERERMLAELKAKKTEYNTGFWNANSVLIGGLGQDPVVNEADLLSMMEGLGVVKDAGTVSQVSFSSDRKSYTSSMSNRESLGNKTANSMQAKSDVSSKDRTLSHQERLERLWTILCMPKAKRLDMAIKYSGESHKNRLGDALDAWEAAATAIIEREALLTKLENFERDASNPNRFFEKGEAGTSLSRIRESKVRDSFDKKMSDMDREVKRTATLVKKQFGDEVIFQGRPCLDKLRHDRTEMLYWLQQERRKQFLNKEMMKEVSLTLLELPPLSANSML